MLVQCRNSKRDLALRLRDKGQSYKEISLALDVSKSTLSYWLSKVEISKEHKLVLLQKQNEGRKRGAQKRRDWRIEREKSISDQAAKEISGLSRRDLWLLGIMAYWCEGSKQKANNVSGRVIFTNSDPFLIKLFIRWLRDICKVEESRLVFNIYVHKTRNHEDCLNYWSKFTGINKNCFGKTILKKHSTSANRKYDNSLYFGLLRLTVRSSTDLNRQIKGWVDGIDNFLN